jgi:hypothetical protein
MLYTRTVCTVLGKNVEKNLCRRIRTSTKIYTAIRSVLRFLAYMRMYARLVRTFQLFFVSNKRSLKNYRYTFHYHSLS